MAQAKLLVVGGRLKGQHFLVDEDVSVTLGRSLRSDIQLPDQGISRLHCRVDNKDGALEITDLNSSNGTQVNGESVQTRRLTGGEILVVGSSTLQVQILGNDGQPQKVPPRRERSTTLHFIQDEKPKSTAVRRKYDRRTATIGPDETDSPALAKTRKRLAAICEMTNTIYSKVDLLEILNAAAETILEVSGADRSAIVMLDKETNALRPMAVRGKGKQTVSTDFPVSRTIVEETLRQGVSLISSDAAQDERFKLGMSVVAQNIHSVMCAPLRTEEEVIGAIYVDSTSLGCLFTEAELSLLAAVGQQAGIAIERARLIHDLENLFVGSMRSLIATIEAKDPYTRGHSERVTVFALMIADEHGVDKELREIIELSGVLHDVGKIGVPENILLKPGKLTDEEFDEIKKHPGAGARIIENMPEIGRIANMRETVLGVRHHHERFDGTGYPDGLAGTEIPLVSRVLAVADTYDAITSDRPYRKGRDNETAVSIIGECAGTQLDPEMAEALSRLHARNALAYSESMTGRFRIGSAIKRSDLEAAG